MYDYKFLYRKLTQRYGNQNGLHDKMLELNSKAEKLSYDSYFRAMKEICKGNPDAYRVYFDNYMKWYDSEGLNIVPNE